MRKALIITISAVLLLCAVFCTAGCVSSPETDVASSNLVVNDPALIIGDWLVEDGSAVTTVSFSEDKAGSLFYDVTEEGSFTTMKIDFTWEYTGDTTYLLTIAGELFDSCTLNADGSRLTLDGSVFSLYVAPEIAGLVLKKSSGSDSEYLSPN